MTKYTNNAKETIKNLRGIISEKVCTSETIDKEVTKAVKVNTKSRVEEYTKDNDIYSMIAEIEKGSLKNRISSECEKAEVLIYQEVKELLMKEYQEVLGRPYVTASDVSEPYVVQSVDNNIESSKKENMEVLEKVEKTVEIKKEEIQNSESLRDVKYDSDGKAISIDGLEVPSSIQEALSVGLQTVEEAYETICAIENEHKDVQAQESMIGASKEEIREYQLSKDIEYKDVEYVDGFEITRGAEGYIDTINGLKLNPNAGMFINAGMHDVEYAYKYLTIREDEIKMPKGLGEMNYGELER